MKYTTILFLAAVLFACNDAPPPQPPAPGDSLDRAAKPDTVKFDTSGKFHYWQKESSWHPANPDSPAVCCWVDPLQRQLTEKEYRAITKSK